MEKGGCFVIDRHWQALAFPTTSGGRGQRWKAGMAATEEVFPFVSP